jgi:hypothetical protein
MNCDKGGSYRKSYTRKGKHEKRALGIHSQTRRVPGIGPLRKGELSKFGYENVVKLSLAERKAALTKAVDAYGSLGVWRKLNAVSIYTRRISPASRKVFKADMDWIRAKFGIKAS